jgi:DNA-binding transcriptional regulator YdaS (Cro superfamily)
MAAMNLHDYLTTTTQQELADRLGVTQGIISQWVLGRVPVPPERAAAIERATQGEVTRVELRPDVFGPLGIRRKRRNKNSPTPHGGDPGSA